MTGQVMMYDAIKGFGFIKEDNCDAQWFFHRTSVIDLEVTKSDFVYFEEGENRKGVCAIKIKRITIKP